MGRYIMINEENRVTGIRTGESAVVGEIESNTGQYGQIMQPDGTFITPEPIPVILTPTLEEQMAILQSDNLILMDALTVLGGETVNIYTRLVEEGKKTIEEVPEQFKAEIQAVLDVEVIK